MNHEIALENPYKSKETLKYVLFDTIKGDEIVEQNFKALYELEMNGAAPMPYWIDQYNDEHILEHVDGMYDGLTEGQTKKKGSDLLVNTKWENNPIYKDKIFVYVDSMNGVQEMEFQAEDGSLVYYNIGLNYFRIWAPKELIE